MGNNEMADHKRLIENFSDDNYSLTVKVLKRWDEIKECLDWGVSRTEIYKAGKKAGYFNCGYSLFVQTIRKKEQEISLGGAAGGTDKKRLIEYLSEERYSEKAKILKAWDKIKALLDKGMERKQAYNICKDAGYFDSSYPHFLRTIRKKIGKSYGRKARGGKRGNYKGRLIENSSTMRVLKHWDEIKECLDQGIRATEIHPICKKIGYVDCGYPRFIQILQEQRKKEALVEVVSGSGKGVANADGKAKQLPASHKIKVSKMVPVL